MFWLDGFLINIVIIYHKKGGTEMKEAKWIKPFYYFAAVYDGLLGLVFLFASSLLPLLL